MYDAYDCVFFSKGSIGFFGVQGTFIIPEKFTVLTYGRGYNRASIDGQGKIWNFTNSCFVPFVWRMDKGEDCMSFCWSCHVCRWKENQPKGQSCHGRTLWRFGNREAKTVSLWQAKSGEGIMSRTQKMYAGSLSLTCEHVHHFSLEALRQSWSFRVRFFKRIGHDHGWSLLKQDLLHQTYQCFVTQCAMKILIVSSLAESWGKWFDVLIPRISP